MQKSVVEEKRRGRPSRTMVDIFKVQAWTSLLACCTGRTKASELASFFGTGNDTRMWDKYVRGSHTPSAIPNRKGKESIAMIVGKMIPGSLTILAHPVWDAMKCKKATPEMLMAMFERFDPSTVAYYRKLASTRDSDSEESLYAILIGKIWIEPSDYIAALDHLAANLMLCRSDIVQINGCARSSIAENIMKALGPLSNSPWFFLFYEDFYDYLEKKVWGHLFDHMYHESLQNGLGWRKTQDNWIPSVHWRELLPDNFFDSEAVTGRPR